MKQPQDFRSQPTPLRVCEHTPAFNERAEQVVLGTLLNFPNRIEEVSEQLRPQDFYVNRHKILYEIMLAYYRKHGYGADYLTLCEQLSGNPDLNSADLLDLQYLSQELWSVDLMQDVRLILGPAVQRAHESAALELAAIARNITDPDEARKAVENLLYNLTLASAPVSDFESTGDIAQTCLSDTEYAYQHRGELTGIPTGFGDLDLMTSGLQRSDLILLAGRPSMGKTALGMGIAYNAARRGNMVAVFSLEMGKKQLVHRLLALTELSGVPTNRQRTGWVDGDEWDRLVRAGDTLSEMALYIDDTSGAPISSIRSKLKRLRAKTRRAPDLVVVDYLGLMEDEDTSSRGHTNNRNEEISRISRGLKSIAREFNVPVLALAQLSRAVEGRNSKIPQLSDLRDSGSLEQDADIVAFVYRDDYYNPQSERKGIADVIVAKHRNGPVGSIALCFDGSRTEFSDGSTKPEPIDVPHETYVEADVEYLDS